MIVVTTPTGQVGHQVVDSLLSAGEQVRVIARDPSRLPPGVLDPVDVVPGSHGDPEVLDTADDVVGHDLRFTRPAVWCQQELAPRWTG